MSVIVNQRSKGLKYIQDVPPTNSEKLAETFYSQNNKDLYHKVTNQEELGFDNGFNTVLFTATGVSGLAVTGVGFQPDLVWLKCRETASNHTIYDSVRGATNFIIPSESDAESTVAETLKSFDSDGFTLGDTENTNYFVGDDAVAWCWSCPSDASHASHDGEKYNADTGVSIIKYTGNGTAGRTIQHSLGKKPALIIIKNLPDISNWSVYHKNISANNNLVLNESDASTSSIFPFNNTEPTDQIITFGTSSGTNGSGDSHIAYLFAEIPGYSSFGSYTGNGSSNGPRIRCGFKPAFLIIKNTLTPDNWLILDNKRDSSNPRDQRLTADQNSAEFQDTDKQVDFLEDGFQIRSSNQMINKTGDNFIYIVFADTTQTVDQFKRVLGGYGPGSDNGYIMGGRNSGALSTIQRMTFPFDSGTSSKVGNLSASVYTAGSFNSSTYGYCVGGHDLTGYNSYIDRITFPLDSGSGSIVGNLAHSGNASSCFNSSNHGYTCCGANPTCKSTIQRLIFPFDSGDASIVGNVNISAYSCSGCNSSLQGYAMSGYNVNNSTYSNIDRVIFPHDSGVSLHTSNLTTPKSSAPYSSCNSSIHGICPGGLLLFTTGGLTLIERFEFPFDSGTASHTSNLSGSRLYASACNSTQYGYIIAGATSTVATYISNIERMEFPFNVGTSTVVGNLTGTNENSIATDGVDFVSQFIQNSLNV